MRRCSHTADLFSHGVLDYSLAKDVVVSVVKAATTYLMLPATPPSFASLSLRAGPVYPPRTWRRNNVARTLIGVFKIMKGEKTLPRER